MSQDNIDGKKKIENEIVELKNVKKTAQGGKKKLKFDLNETFTNDISLACRANYGHFDLPVVNLKPAESDATLLALPNFRR